MSTHPTTAMLLAAGRGTRMRPLTDATAKALLPLGGRQLIDHALDHLVEAGVDTVVVNAFWQADRLAAHLDGRTPPRIILRRESSAAGHRRRRPRGAGRAWRRAILHGQRRRVLAERAAARRWRGWPRRSIPTGSMRSCWSTAPRRCAPRSVSATSWWTNGARRAAASEREVVPYLYAGVQVVSPALFAGAPDGPFSMNLLWDRAIAADRLRAVVHDGLWFHLSTPADLSDAELVLALRQAG